MDIQKELESYVVALTAYHKEHYAKQFPNLVAPEFEVQAGKRFAKIIEWNIGHDGKRYGSSVHCFVELSNGNIWKSASWSQPQKNGIRGNVRGSERPLSGFDYYGSNPKFLKHVVK